MLYLPTFRVDLSIQLASSSLIQWALKLQKFQIKKHNDVPNALCTVIAIYVQYESYVAIQVSACSADMQMTLTEICQERQRDPGILTLGTQAGKNELQMTCVFTQLRILVSKFSSQR